MTMAKAIAAFIGSVITALFASGTIPVDGTWQIWLGLIGALCTAVVTYAVPNRGTSVVKNVVP